MVLFGSNILSTTSKLKEIKMIRYTLLILTILGVTASAIATIAPTNAFAMERHLPHHLK